MMCARATDMIGEFVTAVANNMTVSQLLKGMRAHPTYNEGIGEALEELDSCNAEEKEIIFYNFEEEEHIWEVFLIFWDRSWSVHPVPIQRELPGSVIRPGSFLVNL